ncbi:sigma-70 family RNA polymerase sigma factor [bacterium]|nr:sigma-70 family RNA polymerase sigma factor [bacterium]
MVNSDYKNKDFESIISSAQKGDIKALEELLRRIQRNVFGMFSYLTEKRQDVADLTQDALLKTAKCLPSLKEPKCFKSWLNHIVTNIYHDYLRKHASDEKIEHDSNKILEIKDKIGCEPGEKCLFSEMDKLIRAALLSLPQKLRIVIVLREYEGLSYEDISKITDTSLGTVKSRISRARLKLQNALKEFI